MTESVLVTGGLGRSGRWLVDHLADDYEVVCVDFDHPGFEVEPRENVDFRALDLTDRGSVFDLVTDLDPDAVVHWGAIPAPERHAGGDVFENNTLSTYNVLVAAGRVDARVVWASSESSYGFPFAREKSLPDALPITEAHAQRPEDPYGTSKVVGEEIAKIRPSWIQYPGEYTCRTLPSVDWDDPSDLEAGAGNFWSYVDIRDVASLVAAALDHGLPGHEAFHAAASENYLGRPTTEAVAAFFDALPEDCDVDGDQSALSTAKAGRLLDWEPSHSWREAADEDVDDPVLFS